MSTRQTLPVLPLRGTVIFPGLTAPIAAGRPGAVRICRALPTKSTVAQRSSRRLKMGDVQDFPVPPELTRERKLVLKWIAPSGEGGLNWRQKSRLAEVWPELQILAEAA